MFQEGQAPSPARRFTSPMVRRRLPTASNAVSPQGNRKLSHSGSKPKLGGLARRKKSAQELSRSASPDPPAFFFCDDPRSMQIKEQVCVCVCVCMRTIIILRDKDMKSSAKQCCVEFLNS